MQNQPWFFCSIIQLKADQILYQDPVFLFYNVGFFTSKIELGNGRFSTLKKTSRSKSRSLSIWFPVALSEFGFDDSHSNSAKRLVFFIISFNNLICLAAYSVLNLDLVENFFPLFFLFDAVSRTLTLIVCMLLIFARSGCTESSGKFLL